jgi:hypothetical protein
MRFVVPFLLLSPNFLFSLIDAPARSLLILLYVVFIISIVFLE